MPLEPIFQRRKNRPAFYTTPKTPDQAQPEEAGMINCQAGREQPAADFRGRSGTRRNEEMPIKNMSIGGLRKPVLHERGLRIRKEARKGNDLGGSPAGDFGAL
ncbi:hypothetical protein B0H13DRAFT_1873174 [Mycena leptocephala]|nr:hypothetical protein B0H13DRAFT_1873174 [Mycena leptocephala]